MIPTSYIDAITPIAAQFEGMLPVLIAAVARISAIVFLTPGFGEQAIPMRVRLMIVFALTAITAPGLDLATRPDNAAQLASLIGAEAANGLIIGFSLRSVIFILQICGAIIAQSMSLTQLLGVGLLSGQESALSSILIAALLAAGAALGLHVQIAALVVRTYEIFPAAAWPIGADVAAWSMSKAAQIMEFAFSLAIPFIIFGLAYSLALAAASRAMPQLSAVFVGAPASLFAGLSLFAAASLVMVDSAVHIFTLSIESAPWGGE